MINPALHDAFSSVRTTLKRSLRRILSCPEDVEDVIQETYLRAVANNATTTIADPKAYLFRTSRNIALNEKARFYRQLEAVLPVEEIDRLTVLMDSNPVEQDAARKEQFAELCVAISTLPMQCRRVFVLRKVYGHSELEISKQLGIATSTVEGQIVKGMRRIRQLLGDERAPRPMQAKSRKYVAGRVDGRE